MGFGPGVGSAAALFFRLAVLSPRKELSQAFDKRRYPDLVLNPERLAQLRATGASEALIHGVKGGTTQEVSKSTASRRSRKPTASSRD